MALTEQNGLFFEGDPPPYRSLRAVWMLALSARLGRSRAKDGVHNVHTLGFGSGRTAAGLGRIGDF
ncbi:MAG TPA: hypothetical protein VF885_20780, partial [Arthrobacter sp.]